MSALIASFKAARAKLDTAPNAAGDALTALVNERPATLADFAAKMTTLAAEAEDDGDFYIMRRLAEDAAILAGRTAQ